MALNNIYFTQSVPVFDLLPKAIEAVTPLSFEALHQAYGYVLYRTAIPKQASATILKINGLRDYAVVMLNGKRIAVLDRRLKQDSLLLPASPSAGTLDILVENMGRINFGPYLLQNTKGITGKVVLNGNELRDWKMYGLSFDKISAVAVRNSINKIENTPVLKKGIFELNEPADTYLDFSKWGKGCVWVNGHNLGRYWSIGPQQTIYLPAEWLKKGKNEIEVFEMLKPGQEALKGVMQPVLNKLQAD